MASKGKGRGSRNRIPYSVKSVRRSKVMIRDFGSKVTSVIEAAGDTRNQITTTILKNGSVTLHLGETASLYLTPEKAVIKNGDDVVMEFDSIDAALRFGDLFTAWALCNFVHEEHDRECPCGGSPLDYTDSH